jgi:tRNA pseudouridine55 synthase
LRRCARKDRRLTGGLLIDKPEGLTSHDVVARVRRALGTRAVGHAGTLDPFATGLLIVLVGRATRLARFVERQPKRYRADVTMGTATDTDDRTGTPIREQVPSSWPAQAAVRDALLTLRGTYPQAPPAYSARKVEGRRAYAIARAGGVPELEPREVTVHSIGLLRWAPPVATIEAVVSAGTYVRALARDLGERLGSVAHCSALRREAIGAFRAEDALTLDRLAKDSPLLPPLALVGDMVRVELDAEAVSAVAHGRPVPAALESGEEAALVAGDRLIAVATLHDGWWQPRVVLEAA